MRRRLLAAAVASCALMGAGAAPAAAHYPEYNKAYAKTYSAASTVCHGVAGYACQSVSFDRSFATGGHYRKFTYNVKYRRYSDGRRATCSVPFLIDHNYTISSGGASICREGW